ncbi:MAG: PAS domain-containing sensor histidine kinase [Rhodoferax sp.]
MPLQTPEIAAQTVDDAQRYRDYAEMSSDWYWEQDEQFRFTYFSREFEAITGVPSSGALGRTRWDGLGRDALGGVDWAAHRRDLEAHRPFRDLEYPTRRADGKMVWFRVSGKPRWDGAGRFLGYYGIARDISAQKDMLFHLDQAQRLAALGQLAAGTAHEINNPVGFVRSNLSALEKAFAALAEVARCAQGLEPGSSPGHPALAQALRQADVEFLLEDVPQLLAESRQGLERITRIVADLRAFACEGRTEQEACELRTCVERAVSLLENTLGEQGVRITRDYDNAAQELLCRPVQITQVAHALLSNAVQALAGRGGQIVVRTGGTGPECWFSVQDDGCGIAHEHLHRIFEPFFTTRDPGQGTGMGLATSFAFVREHGGHIDVRSTPGQGTWMRVRLPVTPTPPKD